MNPRFRPLRWLFSLVAILALSLGVAHAQPPDDGMGGDDALTGDDGDDEIVGDDGMGDDGMGDDATGDDGMTDDATTDDGTTDVGGDAPPAAAAPSDDGGGGSAGYKKGFYINGSDGNFALRTQAYVQPLLYFESDNDAAVDERTTSLNFRLNRARLTFSGHAFADNIKYRFQSDFARGGVSLKDFYIDYGISDSVLIRVGQYKRPFSRQQLNSSTRLELVTRSITDASFLSGRDLGIMVHNNYTKSPDLEWAIGVFNARRADGNLAPNWPDRMGPALVVRVGINRGRDANGKPLQGYAEGDVEGGPLRFGVAASVLLDLDTLDGDDDSLLAGIDGRNILGEIDFVLKANGASATGGFYIHSQETLAELSSFLTQYGLHLQGGYMLTPKHQVAGRFALVSVDNGVDRTSSMEASLGHTLYAFMKHNVKWQTEIRIRGLQGEDFGDEIIGYSQLQLSF